MIMEQFLFISFRAHIQNKTQSQNNMFGNSGRNANVLNIILAIMAISLLSVMAMPSPDEERYLDKEVRIV